MNNTYVLKIFDRCCKGIILEHWITHFNANFTKLCKECKKSQNDKYNTVE